MLFGAGTSFKLAYLALGAWWGISAALHVQGPHAVAVSQPGPWSLAAYFEAASSGFGESDYRALLAQAQDKDRVPLAYRGAYRGLAVRSLSNPLHKLNGAKAALEDLNRAVLAEPTNPRYRLLRWLLEREIPSWLGLSGHVKEDQMALERALQALTPAQRNQAAPVGERDWVFFLGKVR